MRIEIICTGSELLLDSVNTNGVYISEKLAIIGLKVSRAVTVGDDFAELENVLSESINRCDIVFLTGGLGPTFDDITREVVSKVTGKKLVFNKEILDSITQRFVSRKMEMPKINERQAYIFSGAEIITNCNGTAPGQILDLLGKMIILLPGPPNEMKPMLDATALPYLKKRFERSLLKIKVLHTTGLAESVVDEKIRKIVEIERELEGGDVSFGILARHTGVDIKIMISGTDEMIIDKTIQNLKNEFYDVLADNIYGEDNQTLESVVGELLFKKRKTLSLAESCTGGLISHRITNIAGSSMYFKESVVSYSDISKKLLLDVKEETLNTYGAVSKQVAREMAEGIKKISGTNFGLSATGIAGPKPSSAGKPIGLVFIGIADDDKTQVYQFNFTGTRSEIKDKVATVALDLMRRSLM